MTGYCSQPLLTSFWLHTLQDAQNQYLTVACRKVFDFIPFPPFTRKKEDMEIKDLVKNHVLRFLPAKSLIKFRSVSKEWDHWISSPFLAHQQSYSFQDLSGFFCQCDDSNPTFVTLNHAAYGVPMPSLEFLPDHVDIRSSSNGLLLCQGHAGNNSYYVCNPVNKEWTELPQSMYYHGSEPSIVLAFEPSVLNMGAHYQVICAVSLPDHPIVCFEMYSSQTMSWKVSGEICVELGYSGFRGNGLYMNGIAYWQTSTSKILAFDVNFEIYSILSLPADSPPGGILAKIREKLCYIGVSSIAGNECIIRIYEGVDLSERQRIDVRLEQAPRGIHDYRVLPSVHGDVVMILVGGFIYCYRLSDHRVEMVSRVEGVDSLATTRFLPYVNSIVSVAQHVLLG